MRLSIVQMILKLESSKSMTLDLDKKGFFGGRSEQRTEFRRDQFTMDGVRNLGGETTETQGKSAKDVECLIADAGFHSITRCNGG